MSRRRRSPKLRSNRRRSHKLRSNRRHSRRLSRNVNYALVSNRRHSRRLSRNVNYALVSNRRRSSLRRNNAGMDKAIGQRFATISRAPLFGRIKRHYDKPKTMVWYGEASYPKHVGKMNAAKAREYAERLGVLVPNTLIGSVGSAAMTDKTGSEYQLVETTPGKRMWDSSYPVTVSAYQTTGYIRDFKLGGIALSKAKAKIGTKLYGTKQFGGAPKKRRRAR